MAIDLDSELTARQESIRAKRRENREKRTRAKAEHAQRVLSGDPIEVPIVNVKAKEAPKKTLKESLLSHFTTPAEEQKADPGRVKKTDNLLSHVLPLALSGMLAVGSRNLFREEYKACAPTKEEVSTILLPIFSVIGRHVKAGTEISQDVLDLATALLASITVTTRMAITAQEIRIDYAQRNQSHDAGRNHSGASTGNPRGYYGENGAKEQPATGRSEYVNQSGNGLREGDTEQNGTWEAQQVAELMRRDRQGRAFLGLAPEVPGNN